MYEVQEVRVDPQQRAVWVQGVPVTLSRKEFDLLHALISRAGEVVSRDDLMENVWHTSYYTSSKTIDVHLGWIRRKLGDDARHPHLISTLRGRGLRFEVEPPVGAATLPGAGTMTVVPAGVAVAEAVPS